MRAWLMEVAPAAVVASVILLGVIAQKLDVIARLLQQQKEPPK